jgi:multidrug resistance efflux pump
VEARHLPRSIAALVLIISIVLGLAFIPADFKLVAEGQLQPSDRRDVFVHMDGVVVEVLVDHEQIVEEGQDLVRLTNSELEVEIANLHARQGTTRARIRSVKRSQLHVQSRIEEQDRLAGELLELEQTAVGLDRELALLNDKQGQLVIHSPMDGQVVTWNVRELLEGRPVRIGQSLLTVVDPAGSWELELEMPERKMGHLTRALDGQDTAVPVTFVLASHPEHEFTGQIVEIDRIAEVRTGGQNSVRVRVAIDMHLLPELRGGTTVTGKVLCGRRSVGYVLFHELFETLQRQRLLWL